MLASGAVDVIQRVIQRDLSHAGGIHDNVGNDRLDYLRDPSALVYEGGYLEVPRGAGLGIEIDEELVRERARTGHDWKSPIWRNADGTVAEW